MTTETCVRSLVSEMRQTQVQVRFMVSLVSTQLPVFRVKLLI